MKPTKTKSLNQYVLRMLAALMCLLMLYYVVTRAFPMLKINYDAYYASRAIWLFSHIFLGTTAILIGPFQFIKTFRNKHLKLHRRMGRVYVSCVVLSGCLGMYLALTSDVNLVYTVGLFFLGFAWSTSAIMAFVSIKNKKVQLHKEWMIRSYAITFSFVTFRFFEDIFRAYEIATYADILTLMAWTCWAIPLFFTELFIQGRKIYK